MALSDFRSFFGSLGAAVGDGRESRPEDVAKVQVAMRGLGRYPRPDTEPDGVLDRELDRALRGYQADRGLKRDGWMAPRGATAREIGTDLGLLRLAKMPAYMPETAENRMRSNAKAFGGLAWLGETLGFGDGGFGRAKDYLNHYLAATGTPRALTSKEVEAEPALRNAERMNQARLEALTLTGKTGDESLNRFLKELPDGKPAARLKDKFETPLSFWDHLRRPGTYFAFGRAGVRSDLDAMVKKVGERIAVDGWVTHRLDNRSEDENKKNRFGDTYNFEQPQPGSSEAKMLEPRGLARPFDMGYERKQSLTAIIRQGRDGELTVERAIWGDPR